MPTAGRRALVPRAVAAFLTQSHGDAELLILDDGADTVADVVLSHPRIIYVREEPRRTLGAKRNRLCEMAQGDIIVHWDDDDWYAPDRLARHAEALRASGAEICGLGSVAFLADDGSIAWDYTYRGNKPWICGSSLAYLRSHWQSRPFPEVASGEDTSWVFSAPAGSIHVMPDVPETLLIARVHPGNTSAKRTTGSWWKRRDPEPLRALTRVWTAAAGAEAFAAPAAHAISLPAAAVSAPPAPAAAPLPRPLANVYACLVHERPECVIDLARNLRSLDGTSPILLYDGSPGGGLLDHRLPWARWGVEMVPDPRPMRWGKLHDFALDCIAHLGQRPFNTITFVDSDQLMLRPGYVEFLSKHIGSGVGLLSPDPILQGPATGIGPAVAAQRERDLWLPYLRRFQGGENKFVYWTFWPGTVMSVDAARAVHAQFSDPMLADILARSALWATEEVLFPTLTALLGFEVSANPCAQDWVKFRKPWSQADVQQALVRPNAFFMHPVPRLLRDPLRDHIRRHHRHYRPVTPPDPARTIVEAVRPIDGWLEDVEAMLLIAAARRAVQRPGAAGRLAEIGSFCGKATVLLALAAPGAVVEAIDRFDGVVGSRDGRLERFGSTRARFEAALRSHGVSDRVRVSAGEAGTMRRVDPVDLLLVDGLHDYASVAGDFAAFDQVMRPGSFAAFHDYADYFPGVVAFVDELVGCGEWSLEARASSLVLLRRVRHLADEVDS